jgi:hypothetical protein
MTNMKIVFQSLTVNRGYVNVFKDEDAENFYVVGPAQLYCGKTYPTLEDAIKAMDANWALQFRWKRVDGKWVRKVEGVQ